MAIEHTMPTHHQKTEKVASILLLLANYALTASAAPLGAPELAQTKFYFLIMWAILLVIYMIYELTKTKSPLKVVGLVYDKQNHKIELTVKNTSTQPYNMKSALRLIQPTHEVLQKATSDGNIPMSKAQASTGSRQLYQLLGEDDTPQMIAPDQMTTILYDLLVPRELITIDDTKNIEVNISYSGTPQLITSKKENTTTSAPTQNQNTKKTNNQTQDYLLNELLNALEKSTDDAVTFYLSEDNHLAKWMNNVVCEPELAKKIQSINPENQKQARQQITDLITERLESQKHPYLRRVTAEKKLTLCKNTLEIIAEIHHLGELAQAIECSDHQTISHHTSCGNDFAYWIQASIGDSELAGQIRSINCQNIAEAKKQMSQAIRQRIENLKN